MKKVFFLILMSWFFVSLKGQILTDTVSNQYGAKTPIATLLKTRNDSLFINGYAKMKLKSWQSKIGLLAALKFAKLNTIAMTPTIAVGGDSVGFDWIYSWFESIFRALGYGGFYGGVTQLGVENILAGGAAQLGVPVLITTLTNNGAGLATATINGHGLSNGQIVVINGATNGAYNVTATVSGATTNTFSYSITGSPTSPDPSGQIYFTASRDFSKWVTGVYTNVPAAGSLTTFRNTNTTLLSDTLKSYKIYYIKESGGGTFKVQTSLDNATYTDVSGYTSISCNSAASDSVGVIEVPLINMLNPFIRILGITGNCKIAGTGRQNIQGGRLSNLYSVGGIMLKDQASTPEQIWAGLLQSDKPDVMVWSFKDDTTVLAPALQKVQGYFNKYAPQCASVYSLIYSGLGDSTLATYPGMNTIIRQWFDTTTISGEKYIFDQYSLVGFWKDAAFKGMFDVSSSQLNVSSATYSGSIATVTTTVNHGFASGRYVRVNEVLPQQYNGVHQITVTGVNTFTYIPTLIPLTSGVGGITAGLDVTHAGNGGRQVIGIGFNRDFQLLTGLNTDYPFNISSRNLSLAGVILNTGGAMLPRTVLQGDSLNFTGTAVVDTLVATVATTGKLNATGLISSSANGSGLGSGLFVGSNNPAIGLSKLDNTNDNKLWDITVASNALNIRALNDASNSAINAIVINRSGFALSNVTLATGLITPTVTASTSITAPTITATTFNDGAATYSGAQINRVGGFVEMQYPGAAGVRFFGSTANATTFNNTGTVTFAGTVTMPTLNATNIGATTFTGLLTAPTISSTTVTAATFNDGTATYSGAQINRPGGFIELQYPGAAGVRMFGNTATQVTFSNTGTITFPRTTTGTPGTDSIAVKTSTGLIRAISPAYYLVNPLTTTGDIIYSSAGTTAARLPIGTTNSILTVAGGIPGYTLSPILTNLTATGRLRSSSVSLNKDSIAITTSNIYALTIDTTDGIVKRRAFEISPIVKGTYSTTAAAMTTFTVTIGSTQANNTYNLAIAPTTVLAGASYYISAKTTTTFDVTYLTAITGAVAFDWTLFK